LPNREARTVDRIAPENRHLRCIDKFGPADAYGESVDLIEQVLPAALAVITSFTLALVAEWGMLAVIVRVIAPSPRSALKEPVESQ